MKNGVLTAALLVTTAGLLAVASATLPAEGQGGPFEIDLKVNDIGESGSRAFTVYNQVGSWPNGQFGAAIQTIACNVGTKQLDWFRAMDPNHPYIASNFYRLNTQGRLEQLAASWVKHGFYALQQTFTDSCAPSCAAFNGSPAGTKLGIGCGDTYGASLNAGRYYLGPREEIEPRVGVWTSRGSFFDNWTVDAQGNDKKSETGAGDNARTYTASGTGTNGKLMWVNDSEISGLLNHATARVFVEVYYVSYTLLNNVKRMDQNKENNHAYRRYRVTGARSFSHDGPALSFNTPVVRTWGDHRETAWPADEGQVVVASRAVETAPSSGVWRYEYNLYNLDLDREVQGLEIPLPDHPLAQPTNFGVWQPRQQTMAFDTAAWGPEVSTREDGTRVVRFAAKPVAAPKVLNTIRWGTMYTFWFECPLPPARKADRTPTGHAMATLELRKTGVAPVLNATIVGPRDPADVTADMSVNDDDLSLFITAYFGNVFPGDFNNDGTINDDDLSEFVNAYFFR